MNAPRAIPVEEYQQNPEEHVEEPVDEGYGDIAETEPEQEISQEPGKSNTMIA